MTMKKALKVILLMTVAFISLVVIALIVSVKNDIAEDALPIEEKIANEIHENYALDSWRKDPIDIEVIDNQALITTKTKLGNDMALDAETILYRNVYIFKALEEFPEIDKVRVIFQVVGWDKFGKEIEVDGTRITMLKNDAIGWDNFNPIYFGEVAESFYMDGTLRKAMDSK